MEGILYMTHQNDTEEKHQSKLPLKLCSTTIKEYNQKKEQVGYRDEKTGHYVLPADWDDGEDYSIYLRD